MLALGWQNFFRAMELRRAWVGAIALSIAHCMVATTSAAVIVNDTWRDGTDDDPFAPVYSENGIDVDLDGDLESAWYQGGSGTLNPAGAGGPQQGILAATGSSSWTTYFTPEATPVTLTDTGDQLRVTWVFTPRGVNVSNTSQNFRLAVVDSPPASRLAVNGSPGSSTYTGYGMFMNMGQTLGNNNPFQLREHDNNGALLSSSGDWLALANGATSGNTGYASDTQYTYTMTITRNAASGLDIVSRMTGGMLDGDGVAEVIFTDATPNGGSFSFDTFALRPSDAATTAAQFDTHLFRVEVIPEPATVALFAFGSLALSLPRRRS